VAAREEPAGGPVSRSRHVVSATVLLCMAAFATWNVVNNGNWTGVVLPFGPQFRADVSAACVLAVICWAGGLGLLTRTRVGLWLGRLGAAVLLGLGIYFGWDTMIAYDGPEEWRRNALIIATPITALLVGAGVGILLALRPRR